MRNKLSYIVLITTLHCLSALSSLKAQDSAASSRATRAVYVELAGNGGSAASINFEILVLEPQLRASVGISIPGMAPGTIPVLLRYLFGAETTWFEVGLGAAYRYKYSWSEPFYEYSQSKVNPTAFAGLRYQPEDGGVMFHIGYTPTYDVGYSHLLSVLGLAVGMAF